MTPTKGTTQEADDVLRTVFGVGSAELEGAFEAAGPLPAALFDRIVEVIDNSGAIKLLADWENQDRKSAAGRTASVPVRAALIVLFLNSLWSFGYSHKRMASTIAHRLTGKQRLQLGITGAGAASAKGLAISVWTVSIGQSFGLGSAHSAFEVQDFHSSMFNSAPCSSLTISYLPKSAVGAQ